MSGNNEKSLWDIEVRDWQGHAVSLGKYRGQVLLIVNVASKCGFTPQYEGLQVIHKRYHDKGLKILAFPCNDFMNQEPGTADEIHDFCQSNYAVSFDLFEKVNIKGDKPHPVYQWLHAAGLDSIEPDNLKAWVFKLFKKAVAILQGSKGQRRNQVQWNFHKFLINRQGKPLKHYSSTVEPLDPQVIQTIESELPLGE
jgi:glutathione peroxidase